MPSPWLILTKALGFGIGWILPNGNNDCVEPDPNGTKTASEDNTEYIWLPLGPVEKVRIHDNVIKRMGMSGISTVEFFDSTYDWDPGNTGPVFIVAAEIDICRNQIEENVLFANLPETLGRRGDRCVGGICLAAAINPVIRENVILKNGAGNGRVPACGIGLVAVQNATIEDNRILDNGVLQTDEDELLARGLRGVPVHLDSERSEAFVSRSSRVE